MKKNFTFKKKHLFWTLGIISFLILLNVGIGFWLKSSFPNFIKERNDTAYSIHFEDLNYSFFTQKLTVKNVTVFPKEEEVLNIDFTANIEELKITGVDFIRLLRKKELYASTIYLRHPEIIYFKKEKVDSVVKESLFKSSIEIENLKIEDANFKYFEADRKTLLSQVEDLDVELSGIDLNEKTLEKKFPFSYSTFEIECNNFFYQLNPSQKIQAKNLKSNNDLFKVQDFEISMVDTEKNIRNIDPSTYRLLPDVKVPEIRFHGLDWGFTKKDNFYFKAKKLSLDSVNTYIPENRNFVSEEKQEWGHLIPFYVEIEKIDIANSKLEIQNTLRAQNLNVEISGIKNNLKDPTQIQKIVIDQPLLTAFSGINSKKKNSKKNKNFIDHFVLKEFQTKNAEFHLKKKGVRVSEVLAKGIDLNLKEIKIDPKTIENRIPLTYGFIKASANSLVYHPNTVYDLISKNILFKNGNLSLNNFELKPKISRQQFVQSLKKEKDYYSIQVKDVNMNSIDFGFQGNDFYLKTAQINLNAIDADIFRSKIPPDDTSKKHLYSKLLREIPFVLEVKKLNIKNSSLVYEEETEKSKGAGKLTFSNFNAKIDHVYSGYKRKTLPDVKLDITTTFMKESKLDVVWTFNSMNQNEKFNITGNLRNFDASKMNPFLKPYLHATADGVLNYVHFNFTGNDINANGNFGIKYKNLKMKLYNPETGKERKVLNLIGNLALKSNSRDEIKEVEIETVERKQDRSFFNFLWLCVQQGLKQSVLVI